MKKRRANLAASCCAVFWLVSLRESQRVTQLRMGIETFGRWRVVAAQQADQGNDSSKANELLAVCSGPVSNGGLFCVVWRFESQRQTWRHCISDTCGGRRYDGGRNPAPATALF